MTTPPLELSRAKRHDIVQAPMANGRLGAQYILSRCGHPEVAYYDEITRQSFPNLGALIQAVKQGGRHHLAVHCVKHKMLEELPEELLEQLKQLRGEAS